MSSTLQVYTPWNMHEPYPGQYVWSGIADLERWMELIQAGGKAVACHAGHASCAVVMPPSFRSLLPENCGSAGVRVSKRLHGSTYLLT